MTNKIKVILLLITLSISLGFMSSTYSRYVASTNGDINLSLSKWQILIQNTDITNSNESSVVINPVIENNDNVADGKMAPGAKGHFDIDIDPTNVDVSFGYNINLQLEDGSLIPDLMISKYTIIPEDYVEGEELDIIYLENDTISNTMFYNKNEDDFRFKTFTIRVYFEWYEGVDEFMNDEEDTHIASLAVNDEASFKMNANINFMQLID